MQSLAMSLPERIGRRTFDAFAHLAYHALPGVRATVAANQAHVVGLEAGDERVRASTIEAFELYARYWFDTFRIRVLPPDEVNRRTQMIDIENIDHALEGGRGMRLRPAAHGELGRRRPPSRRSTGIGSPRWRRS